MLIDILRFTPSWVWVVLAALVALGVWQSRPRSVSPGRLFILPVAMTLLGLASSAATFAAYPWLALAWLKALLLVLALVRRLPPAAGLRWDGERLHLPGSAWPLVVIVSVFLLRYSSAVAMVMHPALAQQTAMLLALTALYGALGGLLWGRALAQHGLTRDMRGATMPGHVQPRAA